MINYFFMEDVAVNDFWFQPDGAIRHTANERINLLKETLSERITAHRQPVA